MYLFSVYKSVLGLLHLGDRPPQNWVTILKICRSGGNGNVCKHNLNVRKPFETDSTVLYGTPGYINIKADTIYLKYWPNAITKYLNNDFVFSTLSEGLIYSYCIRSLWKITQSIWQTTRHMHATQLQLSNTTLLPYPSQITATASISVKL